MYFGKETSNRKYSIRELLIEREEHDRQKSLERLGFSSDKAPTSQKLIPPKFQLALAKQQSMPLLPERFVQRNQPQKIKRITPKQSDSFVPLIRDRMKYQNNLLSIKEQINKELPHINVSPKKVLRSLTKDKRMDEINIRSKQNVINKISRNQQVTGGKWTSRNHNPFNNERLSDLMKSSRNHQLRKHTSLPPIATHRSTSGLTVIQLEGPQEDVNKFTQDILDLQKKYETPLRQSRSVVNDLNDRIVRNQSSEAYVEDIKQIQQSGNIQQTQYSPHQSPKSQKLTKFQVKLYKQSSSRVSKVNTGCVSPNVKE